MSASRIDTPALVVGSGIAGCSAALALAWSGIQVTLLTAGEDLFAGNTTLAQGGIVYQGPDDSPQELAHDVLTAGCRLNHEPAVHHMAENGPGAVREVLLERLKVPFARARDDSLLLTREGGHSHPRVLFCADYTGRVVMETLARAVEAEPNIRVLKRRTAVDLITTHHHATRMSFKYRLENATCGAYVLNQETGEVETLLAEYTVLATGGIGQIFLHTTNLEGSIGSGLAMGGRAGARIMNAEYIQFHPTALYHRSKRRFLISEAVRGEGAKLVDSRGRPFMKDHDPRGDLAPRDVVTRGIMEELLQSVEPCVFLDAANHLDVDPAQRFPTIYEKCLENGIDMQKEPIPVVPAAHYFCGGLLVDIRGRTTLEKLYAIGECSCTGVHGANRLASTSLLEGLLWGLETGRDIAARLAAGERHARDLADAIPPWKSPSRESNEDPALVAQDWAHIRHTMWNYVGISRNRERLARAFDDMRALNRHLHDFYKATPVSTSLVNLFHGCQAAHIITLAALRNPVSAGCHLRKEHADA